MINPAYELAGHGPVPSDRLAYCLGLGVGNDDAGLFFDRRAPFGVITGDGGAVAQQPEQRIGNGWLTGAVTADEPAHHRQVFREPPPPG